MSTRVAICRPPVSIRRGASSTSTTSSGAGGATSRSSTRCSTSRVLCRAFDEGSNEISAGRTCHAKRSSPVQSGCSTRAVSDRSEEYAENNRSYGLATMRKKRRKRQRRGHDLRLPGERLPAPDGPLTTRTYDRLLRPEERRGGGQELLLTRTAPLAGRQLSRRQRNLKSATGGDFSAKHFEPGTRRCCSCRPRIKRAGCLEERAPACRRRGDKGCRLFPGQHTGDQPHVMTSTSESSTGTSRAGRSMARSRGGTRPSYPRTRGRGGRSRGRSSTSSKNDAAVRSRKLETSSVAPSD